MSSTDLRALALVGSLRSRSYNRSLADALGARTPAGLALSIHEGLGDVPLFNEDLESAPPEGVPRLRAAVTAADALVIVTPEYNQSIPAVTKNMVDWLSRAAPGARVDALTHKPIAIIGATRGPWGTRLSQAALRHTLAACGALVMPAPQVYVRSAPDSFDESGALLDARLDQSLRVYLEAFKRWIAGAKSLAA